MKKPEQRRLTFEQREAIADLYLEHNALVVDLCQPFVKHFELEDIDDLTQSAWEHLCLSINDIDTDNVVNSITVLVHAKLIKMIREMWEEKKHDGTSISLDELVDKNKKDRSL